MRSCALALMVVLVSGCGPWGPTPGFRLFGEVTRDAGEDWSFTSDIPEIALQTSTWYLIPHAVTVWCVDLDGELYVGAREPQSKRWIGHISRDPNVRLKIDGRIYERRLVRVEDGERVSAIRARYAEKYDLSRFASSPPKELWYYRVES